MRIKRYLAHALAVVVALLWLVPGASARQGVGAAPTVPPTLEQYTASLLAGTDAPGRDLVALSQRLKLHGAAQIPSTVNATAPNYSVGTQQSFYVANITGGGYVSINATVRYVTPHAYWYVKNGLQVNQAQLQASANRFETQIYPTDRRVFGPETPLGIDNDPRITILMTSIPGVGGYFSNADTYPRIVNPYSNQRDMIYMAVLPEAGSGSKFNYFEATLAHEFQHMIEWNVKRDRDIWLDEGSSEVASRINGYDIGGTDFSFQLAPDTQLNSWSDVGDSAPHYGAAYLFLRYLMAHYGGEGFMTALLRQPGQGAGAIDSIVKRTGNSGGFERAFEDWTVANVLNDPIIAGGRYSYPEGGGVSPDRVIRQYPATRNDTVHQYAADYIALNGGLPRGGTVVFKGNSVVRVIGTDPHSGQSFWYSNRRDSGDATLTREFDLSHVRAATLRFWTWYDIEKNFDYAYIEASTDGGKNWTTLKGKYTTTQNPNGSSFGDAWTGISHITPSGTKPKAQNPVWVEEAVDLGAYTGRRVILRFEYVTDEGYSRPGMAIDDVRIPEIGYSDNAETPNGGWTAQGFVRIGSREPERWFVALIEIGSGRQRPTVVREMIVGANGQGTIDLTPLNGRASRNDVLVIAPLAPKTTELGNYSVTVLGR